MYDVRSSSSREICVNECPRKEWRGGREKTKDKEQSSKGSVDKPQDLEEPKERKRKGRGTCRHQVGPKTSRAWWRAWIQRRALRRVGAGSVAWSKTLT
jgi:hypothetical protein